MAGTVAKRPVHNFSHDLNHGTGKEGDRAREYSDHSERPASQSMDEDDILAQLEDDVHAEQRALILDELTQKVRRDGGRLPFDNRHALFRGLTLVLLDQNWELRLKCIQFICELIPQFGPELDSCMAIVLPQIVANLGDSRVAIRKAVIQTLHVHMKHTTNVQQIFTFIVSHGLQSRDPKVRMEATIQLPVLLTREFASVDLSSVTHALAKKFSEDDETLIDTAGISLERIRTLVGKQQFESYIQQLPSRDRHAYNRRVVSAVHYKDTEGSLPVTNDRKRQEEIGNRERCEFGIIPKYVMDQLLDQTQWKTRANGAEELKSIITSLEDTSRITPHILAFISFLCSLLDDVNFKVTLLTLEIYGVLITKLNSGVKQFLKPLISALTKRFGDNKIVIRQANMKVLMQLMHVLTPKSVVNATGDSLKHRKSGVREEALNIIIASLLTFPSYDFDLAKLCQMLAPTLGDAKRRVRQAALESFAVLAQAMGPSRITPLIHAVDQVELNMDEEGVMKAVQARLARRRLPRLNEDGLVEYATIVPMSATNRNTPTMSKENDIQWIMKGSGSITTGSARERSQPPSFELPQPSPTRAIPGQSTGHESSPPKRYLSAGKGRAKLPWEDEGEQVESEESLSPSNNTSRVHKISSAPTQKKRDEEKPPPIRARNTWDGAEESTDSRTFQDRRRTHSLPRDSSPEAGYGVERSYRKIHLDKLKQQSLATYPGSRGSPSDEPQGSSSAPATERGGHDPFAAKKRGIVRHETEDLTTRLGHADKYVSSFGPGNLKENGLTGGPIRAYRNNNLSSSWPDSRVDDGSKSGKKFTPLNDAFANPPDWSPENEPKNSKGPGGVMASPIHLKPTLARSAGRRGQGRSILDPLEKNQGFKPADDILDLDTSPYLDDFELSDDEDSELDVPPMSSLENVRRSADKKRAEKLASRDPDRHSHSNNNLSSSRVSPLDESGIFSMFSTMNSSKVDESLEYYVSKRKARKPVSDVPFSTRPRMARSSSGKGSRKNSLDHLNETADPNSFEYSPSSGVTFRDKPTSDVSIVGQGYSNGGRSGSNRSESPPIPTHAKMTQDGRDKRRPQKGPRLSPLSMASLNHPGAADQDDKNNMVIGKNVFNGKNSTINYSPSPNQKKSEAGESRRQVGELRGQFTQNYGDSSSPADSNESQGENEDKEDAYNVAKSKALQDKTYQRQKELEQRQAETQALREKAQQEREERRRAMDEEREARRRAAEEEREAKKRALEAERQERRRVLEEKAKKRKEAEEARNRVLEEERKEAIRKEEEEKEVARQRAERRQRNKLRNLELDNNNADITGLQISGSNPANTMSSPVDVDQANENEMGADSPSSPTKVVGKPPMASITAKKKKHKSPPEPQSPKHHSLGRSISGSSNSLSPSHQDGSQGNIAEMKPVSNPDKALQEALKSLADDDWEVKMEGLQMIRRLSTFHPDEVISQMHTVVVAVLNEVKNLRSTVCKMAIIVMGDMFQELQQELDKDLDQICKILIPKAGESSAFIREDVDRALESMVQNVSPQRALGALINAGVSHKNQSVRKTTAMHLDRLVDRMGPGRLLSGVKDITDKILPTAARLAVDSAQETRFYARKMLYSMMQHESFNKLLEKHIPAKDLRPLKEVLDTLKQKGPGDLPHDSSSARLRRSHSNTRNNIGSVPSSREKLDQPASERVLPSAERRITRQSSRSSETNQEIVKDLCKLLSAADWTERLQGITQVQEMCETNVEIVTSNIIKIFDNFTSRLTDSNSKVNQAALQTMLTMVPRLGEYLAAVVTGVVPVVSGNLASKNAVICRTSEDILDSIINHVDMIVLVQPFSSATQYGNARVKPKMVEKLAYLSTKVYPRKQQTVVRNVLPVLWHLLGSLTGSGALPGGTGNLRTAVVKLATDLHKVMGEALLQHASSLPPRQRNALTEILGV